MIIYSIYDKEVVFGNQGYGEHTNISYSNMDIGGVSVQVSKTNNADLRIERILSTNPRDYLNPKLQPGCLIQR
ncbi:YlzJ-like protein [Ruminiclostridium sufflavum DSM 19573]|uniref:YlzJ-like protein n=1 Tax=Ruminiclostridium sufflavum DSM 19573 TaxID=1121337 RepID=A0A318Y695_9FIRM|nr:YlzJ-like family protein [Ruminiclostridium sufflavum]PYG87551.1 YlzJ-like protein [Ruminiclostridium sufflavum DSM 19573]